MNFNDLSRHFERVYASAGETLSTDFQGNSRLTPGKVEISIGYKNSSSNENKVMSTISVIANLKDNLKSKMMSQVQS